MNRRDALKLSLAGIGGAFSTEAEATPGENLDLAMDRLRRRLRRTEKLQAEGPQFGQACQPRDREQAEADEGLLCSGLRTLLVAGTVLDLGEEATSQPAVQTLLAEFGPEADHAIEGALVRLESMSRADRRRIQSEIKRDPGLVEEAARSIAHIASQGGVSLERRFHLRSFLKQVSWSLRHQPLDAVIAEVIGKTRVQEALYAGAPPPVRAGRWAEATERMRRLGEEVEDLDAENGTVNASAGKPPKKRRTAEELRVRASRQATVTGGLAVAGLILLGVGLAMGGIPGPGTLFTIPSFFVFTAALVMLIVTMVTLVLAANARAREAKEAATLAPEKGAATEGNARGTEGAPEASAQSPDPNYVPPEPALLAEAPEAELMFPSHRANAATSFADIVGDRAYVLRSEGWVRTGLSLAVGSRYVLISTPGLEIPVAAPATPAVTSVEGSPAPQLPQGTVVGRAGNVIWVVGDRSAITPVLSAFPNGFAELELAVNHAIPNSGASYTVRVYEQEARKSTE